MCQKALKTRLKLLHGNPIWYSAPSDGEGPFAKAELVEPVVSLVRLDPMNEGQDMSNLDKITIPLTTRRVDSEKMGKGSGCRLTLKNLSGFQWRFWIFIAINYFAGFAWDSAWTRNRYTVSRVGLPLLLPNQHRRIIALATDVAHHSSYLLLLTFLTFFSIFLISN